MEKNCNDFKLLSNKLFVEEIPIEKAVKITTQGLHDPGLFGKYGIANEVLKKCLLIERRRLYLKKIKMILSESEQTVLRRCHSSFFFLNTI